MKNHQQTNKKFYSQLATTSKTYGPLSILLFINLILTSCAPNARSTSAPQKYFDINTGRQIQNLDTFSEYIVNPTLVSLFYWPSEKDLEILSENGGVRSLDEAASVVGEGSTKLDYIFNDMAPLVKTIKKSATIIQKMKMSVSQIKIDKMKAFWAAYACYVDPLKPEKCARSPLPDDKPESVVVPKSCKELKVAPFNLDEKIFFERYACFVARGTKVCLPEGTEVPEGAVRKVPQKCSELLGFPWLSNVFRQECDKDSVKVSTCTKEIDVVEAQANSEMNQALQSNPDFVKTMEQIKNYHLKLDELKKKTDNIIDSIMEAVEPNINLGEGKYTNWLKVDPENSEITHPLKAEEMNTQAPQLKLNIRINNTENSIAGDYSTENGDIEGTLGEELDTPTLFLTIHEKKITSLNSENKSLNHIRTGNKILAALRRSVQPYGLLYVGKVKKIDQDKNVIAEGMMKIVVFDTEMK
jgi:hypothetical protein